MSTTDMVNRLKKRDPITFDGINCSTIERWIDRSDAKPQWKESVLRQVEDGNSPGHDKGSRRGISVCC